MSVAKQIAGDLRIAEEDLRGAVRLAEDNNRNASYLLQQAAEKLIRALLTSEGKHGGIRHRLDDMVGLLPETNPLKPRLCAVEFLSIYATTYRYPTNAGRVKQGLSSDRFDVTAQEVRELLGEAAAHFKVDLSRDATSAAGNITPIR